jgi:hypothetical protein
MDNCVKDNKLVNISVIIDVVHTHEDIDEDVLGICPKR